MLLPLPPGSTAAGAPAPTGPPAADSRGKSPAAESSRANRGAGGASRCLPRVPLMLRAAGGRAGAPLTGRGVRVHSCGRVRAQEAFPHITSLLGYR